MTWTRPTVALACIVALGSLGACSSGSEGAGSDVSVTACDADPGGGRPTAKGQVTNSTKKDSTYAFRITFTDGSGNDVSNGGVTLGRVKPGQTAEWSATGATSAKGPLECKVANAKRTATP